MKLLHALPPTILAVLLSPQGAPSAAESSDAWPAFPVEWRAAAPSPADVSFLLEAPAGKQGFVRVKDGHFVQPDGRRLRFWGVNATAEAALPATGSAPIIAARLAALGVNCVRFHFLDHLGALIPAGRGDTRGLDPQALERLDCFVAELKQRGIYSDLNLNVYRIYKAGDGVRESEALGIGKGATYFDERLIELQREYARQLLTHVNARTGLAYRDEPAVALVEFVNENSLVESWVNDRLLGRQTGKAQGTWNDIPPSYAAALTTKFNAWLAGRVSAATLARWRQEAGVVPGEPLPRLHRKDFAQAAKDRFETEAAFYIEVERNYFRDMANFLRDELGVKSLLVGDSDHNHGDSGYPLLSSLVQLDAVDGHVYWQHPKYLADPKTGRRTGFSIANTPMVDEPLKCTGIQLSRSAVAGKPFTVTEANHPFPGDFACEGLPLLAAFAAFQDWDGVFWYTLAHKDVVAHGNAKLEHFDLAPDPVKLSQLAAGALMFVRGDVQPARRTLGRSYSREQVIESLRLGKTERPYFTPGFPLALPLLHGVRITSFDGPSTAPFEPVAAGTIVCDTGQTTWRGGETGDGVVSIDTPCSQALVGHLGREPVATANLRGEIRTRFCALTLAALDGRPIAGAGRLLLTATARVANTGMVWNEKRTSLASWGTAPVRIEPVTGKIELTALAAARDVVAQPLDGSGQPIGRPLPLKRGGNAWSLELGQPATTWFVISVTRKP
jgi:hypothetical protein